MKRSIIILTLFVVFHSPKNSSAQDTTKVKGGFTSCIISSGYYGDNKEKITYNMDGYMVQYTQSYRDYGKTILREKIRQVFDAKNNIIEYARYKVDYAYGPCNLLEKNYWKYDGSGRLTESGFYLLDSLKPYTYKYIYNADGFNSEIDYYDMMGKMGSKTMIKYIDSGKTIEKGVYDSKDSIQKKEIWSYNTAGDTIEYQLLRYDGKDDRRITYSYNENGRMTEKVFYGKDGKVGEKNKFMYDESGNVTEVDEYDAAGVIKNIETWKYDSVGNVVEYIYYGSNVMDHFRNMYTYKYDEYGNIKEEVVYDVSTKPISTETYLYSK